MGFLDKLFRLNKDSIFYNPSEAERERDRVNMVDEYNRNNELKLIRDIREFKKKFREGDIRTNPYIYNLYTIFKHTDIDKLNVMELSMLGFDSIYEIPQLRKNFDVCKIR